MISCISSDERLGENLDDDTDAIVRFDDVEGHDEWRGSGGREMRGGGGDSDCQGCEDEDTSSSRFCFDDRRMGGRSTTPAPEAASRLAFSAIPSSAVSSRKCSQTPSNCGTDRCVLSIVWRALYGAPRPRASAGDGDGEDEEEDKGNSAGPGSTVEDEEPDEDDDDATKVGRGGIGIASPAACALRSASLTVYAEDIWRRTGRGASEAAAAEATTDCARFRRCADFSSASLVSFAIVPAATRTTPSCGSARPGAEGSTLVPLWFEICSERLCSQYVCSSRPESHTETKLEL